VTQARVKAVCASKRRVEPKTSVGQGEFRAGWGLVGDSHAGPPRPNRWQIALLAWEDTEQLNHAENLDAVPGSFAENLSTVGLDTARLRVGDRLRIGEEVVLEVEQLGKPPEIAHTFNFGGFSLLPHKGVFCGIVSGGVVKEGDPITVLPSTDLARISRSGPST
jgi:MOSC domain-containing protein YiiM